MADRFSHTEVALSDPASNCAIITPSNTVDLAFVSRAICVQGAAGSIRIMTAGGQEITIPNVAYTQLLPIRAKRIYATGTTATSILVLW